MGKKYKLQRNPIVSIFGGKANKWKKKADELGISPEGIIHLERGQFQELSIADAELLEIHSGFSLFEIEADYDFYIAEHERVVEERREKRKQKSLEKYGVGGYPIGDDE